MPPKSLRWWEAEYLKACGLAILYGCTLNLLQFAASRGLEPEDLDHLQTHFEKHNIGC